MEAAVELDERKARVLRAVIQDFIQTANPVGSKSLVDRYTLGISPATVRNELAALEEQGYLSHPHTSAGRVPTDLGYRWYVDTLRDLGSVASAQQDEVEIERHFAGVADLEETLLRTVVLLASLTRLTAVVIPPSLDRSRLRHVELVSLTRRAAMVVLIVETGRVAKRVVELPGSVAPEDLDDLRAQLNELLDGQRLDEATGRLAFGAAKVAPERRPLYDTVAQAIGSMADDQANQRVFIGGQSHIAGVFDAIETVQAVFEALEQQVIMLRLLQAAMGSEDVSVTIGSENVIESMRACSVVVARYPAGDVTGNIGVLGPTRMDYLRAMVAVQAVAKRLGAVLEDVAH
jgi:heat-inducible transcriptional repressor